MVCGPSGMAQMRALGPISRHKLLTVAAMSRGREEGAADLLVAEAVAVDIDIGLELDLRLDLHLPLVLRAEAGLGDHVQHACGEPPSTSSST